MKDLSFISDKQFKYLKPCEKPRPRRFYTLPKIHKPIDKWTVPGKIPAGRPIVSDCSSESEKIAEFIDGFIKSKATKHPSYIKDTYDIVDNIHDLDIPKDALLITLDVESMYTNIVHDNGLEALEEAFEEHEKDAKFHAIMKLLEISLKCNDFEFNNEHFLQICGTSMGKKWAPHYSDIYMAKFEKDAMAKCPLKPLFYKRFLDDVFMIWTHGLEAFQNFLDIFNSHQPPIKFKAEISSVSADFLDTTVFKCPENKQVLNTKVFFKPTDTHQLLFKSSFHPKHTFKSILKSQVIRFHRISSTKHDFEEAWQILYKALSKRNYSKRWMRKIKIQTILELQVKDRIKYSSECNPSSSKMGAKPCGGSRCMTCNILPVCSNFTSTRTKETFAINSSLNCSSSNVIYLYTCKLCHIQYVGETSTSLRDRATRHRAAIYAQKSSSPLYNHLHIYHYGKVTRYDDSHFVLTPIEQVTDMETKSLTKMERLKRETYWIDILHTFNNLGLNSRKLDHLIKRKKKEIMPFVVPFSKTAFSAAKIIKKHLDELQGNDILGELNFNMVTAYSRHKNLKDFLVSSKLKK